MASSQEAGNSKIIEQYLAVNTSSPKSNRVYDSQTNSKSHIVNGEQEIVAESDEIMISDSLVDGYRINESAFSSINNTHLNTLERTRNYNESSKNRVGSVEAASSSNSEVYQHKIDMNQSRDSDKTTNKEIYIMEESSEYPNIDDTNEKMFTPPSKASSIRSPDGKSLVIESKINYPGSMSMRALERQENDSSSSLEPLSSKLTDQKMKIYETENFEEHDIEQIRHTNQHYQNNMQNEGSRINNSRNIHSMENNNMYTDKKYQHINQISGDKQTPSDRQTIIHEENDTPQIEFIPFDEEESRSITEFNYTEQKKHHSRASDPHFYTFSNDTSRQPDQSNQTSENIESVE